MNVWVVNKTEEPDGLYLFEEEEDARDFAELEGGPISITEEPVFGEREAAEMLEHKRTVGNAPPDEGPPHERHP